MSGILEEIEIFKGFRDFGAKPFDDHRFYLMSLNAVLSFISCILMIVAFAGSSLNADTIESTAWTYELSTSGSIPKVVSYFGLSGYSTNGASGAWSDCNESYCSKCDNAGRNERNMAIVVFLICVPLCMCCIARRQSIEDGVLHKLVTLTGTAICCILLIVSLIEWSVQCVGNFPKANEIVYGLGVSYNCTITTLCFLVFIGLCNVYTIVKPRRTVNPSSNGTIGMGSNPLNPPSANVV